MHLTRDEQCAPGTDRDRASVERDMMKAAQTQSILKIIRAAQRMPPQVRRVQANWIAPDEDTPVADSASVLVSREHLAAEGGVAPPRGQQLR